MQFYGAKDLVLILGVSLPTAYKIINKLIAELEAMGKLTAKPGQIQKGYFCEKFMLKSAECDKSLKPPKVKKSSAKVS